MRRILTVVVCGLVVLLGGAIAPARAATPTTLVVDTVVAVDQDWKPQIAVCCGPIYHRWTGYGVTTATQERWKFEMIKPTFLCHPTGTCTGSFRLTSQTHPADSVSGVLGRGYVIVTKVTAGTGRFAGLVSNEQTQAFAVVRLPDGYIGELIFTGSLRFTLNPA